jgi:plasmid stability protein
MATLYVENVPDEIYKALRKRAKNNRSSIAAEVIGLLQQNVPTAAELRERREFAKRMRELSSREPLSPGPFASAEEMIREDRER